MIVYNFDLAAHEEIKDKMEIYHFAGWCYSRKYQADFTCCDREDPSREYPISLSRNFRNDVNTALGIRPEYEPGFSIVINLPHGTKADLVISCKDTRVTLPLDEIQPQTTNAATSQIWKKLLEAVERREKRRKMYNKVIDDLKIFKENVFRCCPFVKNPYMKFVYPLINLSRRKNYEQQTAKEESSANGFRVEHLLIVVHFADRTGAPLLALNIAEQLYNMGYNLHVIVLRDGELVQDLSKYAKIYVAELENEAKFQSILDELAPYKIKTAYLNTTVSGYYAKVLKEKHYHVVTLIHELAHTLQEMNLQTAAENSVNYSDKIIIPSTLIRDSWQEYGLNIPEEKTLVMPQPDYHSDMQPATAEERLASRREICSELGLKENALLVIGCGTLEERKNPDMFFETAGMVAEKHPDVCFIWIGDYGSPLFKSKITMMAGALPDNARLLPYQKLNRFFQAADVFFLSSSADPFPTVALLAAKSSMPVVFCTKSTGVRDLFQDIPGCASSECTAEAFAPLIGNFASSAELRTAAGTACADAYRNKMYSFKQYTARLFETGASEMLKISCIIPNYNYAHFLPSRVNDAVKQSYPVYELIILDDCSRDDSDRVIQELMEKHQKDFPGGIRYVKNTENAGVFRQWMRGASMAASDLIWIAEADDSCSPHLMAKLIHSFKAAPDIRIAYAQSAMVAPDGTVVQNKNLTHTEDISLVKWSCDYINTAKNEVENALSIRNTIPNASAAIIRKDVLLQVPDELYNFRVAGDWFAYLNMIDGGNIAFCAEPLNYYRRHEGSAVAKNTRRLISEIAEIQRFILGKYDLPAAVVSRMKNEYLRCCATAQTEPENMDHFDAAIEARQNESSFLFVFDDISDETFHMLNAASEVLNNLGERGPKRLCFIYCGHKSVPAHYQASFLASVQIVYHDDLCLHGFERAFYKKNNFSGALLMLNPLLAKSSSDMIKLLPKRLVISAGAENDLEQSTARIKKFISGIRF